MSYPTNKKSYILVICIYLALFISTIYSLSRQLEDRLPSEVVAEQPMPLPSQDPYLDKTSGTDGMRATRQQPALFPVSFRGTTANVIRNAEYLNPVFAKIAHGDNVRILQIGDSHVKGKFLPSAIESTVIQGLGGGAFLEGVDPVTSPALDGGVFFNYIGMNGAHASRFAQEDMLQQIEAEHADLVIVSFGTNEAHGIFNESTHQQTMHELVAGIRRTNHSVCILITTPPGSYITTRGSRWRDRRGRWHYNAAHAETPNTERVVNSLVSFAEDHQLAVWDIYNIAGGKAYACSNWRNAGLMQTDYIHYTVPGYTLQGQLLGSAILDAYHNYLQNH